MKRQDERADSASRPMFKLEGAQIADGVLTAIECDAKGGIVLVLKTASGVARFGAADPTKLEFYSQDPQAELKIACGPMNSPVFVHFKPVGGPSKLAGDALAVEFKK